MMPTPVLNTHGNTHRLCWPLPDGAAACLATPDCCAITTKDTKSRRSKRLLLDRASTYGSASMAKRVSLPLRVITAALELVAKSP